MTIKRANLPLNREPDNKDIIAINSFSQRYPIPLVNPIKLLNIIRNNEIVHIIDHWSLLNIISIYKTLCTNL